MSRLPVALVVGRCVLLCTAALIIAQISHAQAPTFFQQEQIHSPSGSFADLGYSVALSFDGNTLVLGAPYDCVPGRDCQGSAYVFVRQGDSWIQKAQLFAADGALGDEFGASVAISQFGDTIVATAPTADSPLFHPQTGGGAAYVFVRPANGDWVDNGTYAAKLTNCDGNLGDALGTSAAISGDGSTVVLGAPQFGYYLGDPRGKAYLYSKPPASVGGWMGHLFETVQLTPSDNPFSDIVALFNYSHSVSISNDGTTVAVGDSARNFLQGGVYVFVQPANGWVGTSQSCPNQMTESVVLLGGNSQEGDYLGRSVAVNFDGGTIVAGAPKDNFSENRVGEGYVFLRPPRGWLPAVPAVALNEAGRLSAPDEYTCDGFGSHMAVSGDGKTVVAGTTDNPLASLCANAPNGPGAAYVFVEPPTGWTISPPPSPAKLTASDGVTNYAFGSSVSLDQFGDEIAVGSAWYNVQNSISFFNTPAGNGAVYLYSNEPRASVSPSTIDFGMQAVGTSSVQQKVTVKNIGGQPLSVTVVGLDPGFQFQGGTPNCIGASPLAPGASCDEYVMFAPPSTGPITGTLSFQDNSGNVAGTQQTVNLSGTGVLAATTITITAVAPSPAVVGQTVTVSFSVGWGANAFNPSGNVSVTANTLESCMGLAVVDNCALSFATYGTRTLTANYAGDSHFNGSTSTSVNLNVGDFSISALPASITVPLGSSGSSQITVGSLGGFSSAITLAASGVPAGVTAAASPSSVSPPAGGSAASTMTVNVGPSITPITFSLNASGAYGALTHSVPVSVTVVATPASVSNVVNQILSGGCIDNSGISNGFKSKLAAAQSAISAGKIQVAVNILAALLNQLQAQSGKHVSTSCTVNGITFNAAAALIMDVQSMITALNLMPNPVIGYVANGSGVGLAGATVSILNGGGTTMASTTTDSTGFYYFANTAIFTIGTNYTAKPTALPSPYKSASPPSQTFTWQGTLVKLNAFTAN